MNTARDWSDIGITLIFLLMSIIELYNSILIIFFNQESILLSFRINLFLYKLMPFKREKKKTRIEQAFIAYKKRIKYYGMFSLVGGVWLVIVFTGELIDLLN